MQQYDFQAAINAAQSVVDRSESNGGSQSYKHALVYPQVGSTIVVRPLFNPKSGQIVRLINRHEKVPCYRTYNIECPICKVMQQVKDMTGQDPFGRTRSSRSRGIAFAQFISSTVEVKKGDDKVNPGDIILLMYPWSVYQQINSIIQAVAQTPTGMDQAFCHASQGLYIQISVSHDFKYTTTQVPYMTFPTDKTDEEFLKDLDDMDSLFEEVIPSSITEEVDKQVKEYADAIYRQYVAPRVVNHGVPEGTAPQSFSSMPGSVASTTAPPSTPTTPQTYSSTPADTTPPPPPPQSTSTRLTCFGGHQQGNPQCICCPDEMICIDKSRKDKGE